jgi:T5orf172 domain
LASGHIYILLNPAIRDMLKIGMTTRMPEERARELSQGTSVPAPFVVAYSEEVPDCLAAETLIHARLAKYRVHHAREFFCLDLRIAIRELSEIAEELRKSAPGTTHSDAPASPVMKDQSEITARIASPLATELAKTVPDDRTFQDASSAAPSHGSSAQQQSVQAAGGDTQYAIIDAILGAFPFSNAGKWLSAKHQIELLQRAYDAKLPDGRNAFPAMHGGAVFGDSPKSWDGADRTNRMKVHAARGLAIKADGRNLYMLAQGVTPAKLGVSQAVVDALDAHRVIPRYDVNSNTHQAPI